MDVHMRLCFSLHIMVHVRLNNRYGISEDKNNALVIKINCLRATGNLDAAAPVAFNGLSPSFQVGVTRNCYVCNLA